LPAAVGAGCSGPQHILEPAGPASAEIASLWWMMFGIATIVTIVVIVLVLVAARTAVRRANGDEDADPPVRSRTLIVTGGVVVPVLVIAWLVVATGRIGVSVMRPGTSGDHLVIDVIGHQYWWEVRYPQYGIETANEIQIPAGVPVRLRLTSPDVIHSFWVPRLQGKIDMFPGRTTTLWIEADEPGLYRGQCAEYCGDGHALMAFWLEALDSASFGRWVADRRTPPELPPDPVLIHGRQIFDHAGCNICHATRGAPLPPELGTAGPDLSDFGRRRTIAAGTLPSNRDNHAAWIVDPQSIKPGSRMPATDLDGESLEALVHYLMALR
jgi:cytochrome c oxidase subunit II